MLGSRFSLEEYAKNVQEKAINSSLKTTELLLYIDENVRSPKFDIIKLGTVVLNCFKSYENAWCFDLLQKNVPFDVRSNIHVVRRNIVSTGQSVQVVKKFIFSLASSFFQSYLTKWYQHTRIVDTFSDCDYK